MPSVTHLRTCHTISLRPIIMESLHVEESILISWQNRKSLKMGVAFCGIQRIGVTWMQVPNCPGPAAEHKLVDNIVRLAK